MSNNKNFDITPLMAPYFDVHMVSPLLDFLLEVSSENAYVVFEKCADESRA